MFYYLHKLLVFRKLVTSDLLPFVLLSFSVKVPDRNQRQPWCATAPCRLRGAALHDCQYDSEPTIRPAYFLCHVTVILGGQGGWRGPGGERERTGEENNFFIIGCYF